MWLNLENTTKNTGMWVVASCSLSVGINMHVEPTTSIFKAE